MSCTVWGTAKKLGGIVATRNAVGRIDGGYVVEDLDCELAGTDIDCDHNGEEVGAIVYAEITPQDQLQVVGVVDDWVAEIDQPIYLSGTYVPTSADGPIVRSAAVAGMSLTFSPAAGAAAIPLSLLPGDLRSGPDRARWPISWKRNSLLERAEQSMHGVYLHERARHRARHLVDRRERYDDYGPAPLVGSQVRALSGGRESGRIWHSAHRGRILRVS